MVKIPLIVLLPLPPIMSVPLCLIGLAVMIAQVLDGIHGGDTPTVKALLRAMRQFLAPIGAGIVLLAALATVLLATR